MSHRAKLRTAAAAAAILVWIVTLLLMLGAGHLAARCGS